MKLIKVTARFKAPKMPLSNYNQKSLSKGMMIEHEHTTNHRLANIIAANHLDEDPKYYDKLVKMEKTK